MPTSTAGLLPARRPLWHPTVVGRGIVALLLVAAIFYLGIRSESVLNFIDQLWHGGANAAATAQAGVSSLVTKRSLVSVGGYALLYTGTCLLLLAVALGTRRRIGVALVLYGAVFASCAVLVVLGKLAGDAAWAYKLARRLIDFIVSPLPVIILVPLLRWYVPNTMHTEPAE